MRRGAASRPQGKASCEGRRDRGRSEGKKQEISTSRANLEGNGAQHASWVWCTPGTIMTSLIHHVFPMKRNTLNTPGHRMPPERVQETGILGGGAPSHRCKSQNPHGPGVLSASQPLQSLPLHRWTRPFPTSSLCFLDSTRRGVGWIRRL